MKKSLQQGFTVLEMLIVLAIIIILVSLAVISFSRGRQQTIDRVAVSDLQLAQLALEEYRAQCRVYPADNPANTFDLSADNAFLSGNTCSLSLDDIWPAGLDETQFEYVALQNVNSPGSSVCAGYHISVEISVENEGLLSEDDDFTGNGDWDRCTGIGTGYVNADDLDGAYDIVMGPSNI